MTQETQIKSQTLIEILRSNQKGYLLKFGYRIELKAQGMHSGPAICEMEPGKKKEVIYTDDLAVLEELWNLLPREYSRVIPTLYYGNPEHNEWFIVSEGLLMGEDYKTAEPFTFVSREQFEKLKEKGIKFTWGLSIIADSPSVDYWPKYIAESIEEIKKHYT